MTSHNSIAAWVRGWINPAAFMRTPEAKQPCLETGRLQVHVMWHFVICEILLDYKVLGGVQNTWRDSGGVKNGVSQRILPVGSDGHHALERYNRYHAPASEHLLPRSPIRSAPSHKICHRASPHRYGIVMQVKIVFYHLAKTRWDVTIRKIGGQ
jgi:hypothetical protein